MTSDSLRMPAVPRVHHLVSAILLVIGFVCLIPLVVTPTARTSISPADIKHEIGKAYVVPLALEPYWPFTAVSDDPSDGYRSALIVYEDGRPLGPPHTMHPVIRESGRGAYSHWGDFLYFSASDGGDPRTNGRSYVAAAKTRLPHSFAAFLIAVSLSCFLVIAAALAQRFWARATAFMIAAFSTAQRLLSNPAVLLVTGLLCLIPLVVTPTVRTSIFPTDIKHQAGNTYVVPLAMDAYRLFTAASDAPSAGRRSTLIVYEDGRLLGPPHAMHAVIGESGSGAYSHWGGFLYFSTSDGSDPRTNGRSYVAAAKTRLPHLLTAFLILVSLACFWGVRRSLKQRFGGLSDSQPVPADSAVTARSALALALVVTGVAFGAAMISGLEYRTNDDVDMRFIAEGLIGDGSQTQFLMYQNVLIGIVLRALYRGLPGLPWYDIALASGAIIGATLCQLAVYRLCGRRRELAFCVLASFFFFAPIFRQFQFTASSTLLAGGALVLFASVWQRPPGGRTALWTASAVIAVAFVLGSLVRFHGAFLAAIAILPVVGIVNLRWPERRMFLPIAALACGAGIALFAQAYDKAYYAASPGWETFWIEKAPRAAATQFSFLDRSRPEEVQAALSAVGWTENDYRMVSGWMFMDRSLFSIERMQRFADLAPKESWIARMANTYGWLIQPQSLVWLLAALCLAPVLLRRSAGSLAIAALSIAWAVIVLFIVGTVFRANHFHVLWPLYAVCTLNNAGLIFSRARREVIPDRFLRMEDRLLAAAALLGMILAAGWQAERMSRQGADSDDLRRKVARDLATWPVRDGDTVVVWDHNFPYEVWARPFRAVPTTRFTFLHTGDPAVTPLLEPIYRKWQTSNVAWAVCNITGTHLVDARLGYARPHADILTAYMREHHGQAIDVTASFNGDALTLYVCGARGGEAPKRGEPAARG